jgi:hypothetical protein
MDQENKATLLNLGAHLGRHQAFALVANRCSAADAEILKDIRDSGDYKELGVTWEEFCVRYVGMTRAYAEQHIHCFEEYGEKYRRVAEIISLSPATYRLIDGAVTDKGLEFHGDCIPLAKENRVKIAAAIKTLRAERKRPAPAITVASLNKVVDKLLQGAVSIANQPGARAELIVCLERAAAEVDSLVRTMRQKTVLVG